MKDLPTKAGKIASMSLVLMLFGSSVLATEPNKDGGTKAASLSEETSGFNWAKLSAEAHVAYVSSGWLPLGQRMIDGDATTGFSFSGSDSQPTAIIELRGTARLNRVTVLYHVEEGRLEIYLLNKLNGSGANVVKGNPVASITTPVEGKAAVDFDPRGARYVVLCWIRKQPITRPLEVAEVGAFSVGPGSVLDLAQPSNGSQDLSNTLGTLANPPTTPPTTAPISP
jgi:hypothetical protein